jgi:hypothetical protein
MNPRSPEGSSLPDLQPYQDTETSNGFEFTTEKGAIYEVYFGNGITFFSGSPLAKFSQLFGFTRKRKVPKGVSPLDDRIKVTIKSILYRILEAAPDIIFVYHCSSERGMQIGRSMIFDGWFDEEESNLAKLDFDIESPNGKVIPASVLLRSNHPFIDIVPDAVQLFVHEKSEIAPEDSNNERIISATELDDLPL